MTTAQALTNLAVNREKALAQAREKTAYLQKTYPEIAEIDSELASVSSLIVAAIGKSDCLQRIEEIKERNLFLQKKRGEILASYGLSPEYDTPVFSCSVCNDTGYDGKTFCRCVIKNCAKDAYLSSGLGKGLLDRNFESFSLKYYGGEARGNMEYVLDTCRHYADSFNGEGTNLLFTGGTGLGKTHLSSAIAQTVIDRGFTVVYESAQNIFDVFEAVRFGKGEGDTSKYLSCDLLVIDDLGSEFSTQYTSAVLYQILNHRIVNGKAMILSTNLGSKEMLKRYGERIYSRILGSFDTCVFTGEDVRLLKLGE